MDNDRIHPGIRAAQWFAVGLGVGVAFALIAQTAAPALALLAS